MWCGLDAHPPCDGQMKLLCQLPPADHTLNSEEALLTILKHLYERETIEHADNGEYYHIKLFGFVHFKCDVGNPAERRDLCFQTALQFISNFWSDRETILKWDKHVTRIQKRGGFLMFLVVDKHVVVTIDG